MAKWLEKQYQTSPIDAVVEDSLTSDSSTNAPSVRAVNNEFSKMADYVVEQGDGYIKYANGNAMCWGSSYASNVTFSQNGSVYRYVQNVSVAFPIKFTRVPVVTVQTASDTDYGWCTCIGVTRNISGISQLCFMRDSSVTGTNIYWHYFVVGRWK